MKFIDVDFAGTLVHELLEDEGIGTGSRCTRCRIDTKYYPGNRADDSNVTTCLFCVSGRMRPRALPTNARRTPTR
jgi:hypothetical protein